MKFKGLLPIAILSVGVLAACGPTGPVEREDGVHTITITNKAALEADWMAGGAARTISLEIAEDGTAQNAALAMTTGDLAITSTNEEVVTVSGLTLNAAGVGTCYVQVKYYDTVKLINMNVVEKPAEPAKVNATVAEILTAMADETNDNKVIYSVEGYIHDWATKPGMNTYGEFNLSDSMEENAPTLWMYGSYAGGVTFTWGGEEYTFAYDTRNFDSADMTKNARIGDKVTVDLIAFHYGTSKTLEAKGEIKSLTRGADVPATSVTLSKESAALEVGATTKVTATVAPWNCNTVGTWASDNTAVATVNGGTITAVAPGNANITYTNGSATATVAVTVTAPQEAKVILTPASLMGYASTNIAYAATEAEYIQDSVTYGIVEIGAYGTGFQCRKGSSGEHKDVVSSLYNKTAFSAPIAKIVFQMVASKATYSNDPALTVAFGTDTTYAVETKTVATVSGTVEYTVTPSAATNTFFKYTYAQSTGTQYWESITVYFAE